MILSVVFLWKALMNTLAQGKVEGSLGLNVEKGREPSQGHLKGTRSPDLFSKTLSPPHPPTYLLATSVLVAWGFRAKLPEAYLPQVTATFSLWALPKGRTVLGMESRDLGGAGTW